MKTEKSLQERKADELDAIEFKYGLKEKFVELCGVEPSIVSAGKTFASFHGIDSFDKLGAVLGITPKPGVFSLTFSGSDPRPTYSPYSIHVGAPSTSSQFLSISIKYDAEPCPIWIEVPRHLLGERFEVKRQEGKHRGFGKYETQYQLVCTGGFSCLQYQGGAMVYYAADAVEAAKFYDFVANLGGN